MEQNQLNINVALEPNNTASELMTEQDFYMESFANLKERKSEIDTEVKKVTDWLKTYMNELGTDALDNEKYTITVTKSTASVIKASDLLREIGMRIPKEIEDIINALFNVNITEAKKKIGALALNKIMTSGKTTETMRLKRK